MRRKIVFKERKREKKRPRPPTEKKSTQSMALYHEEGKRKELRLPREKKICFAEQKRKAAWLFDPTGREKGEAWASFRPRNRRGGKRKGSYRLLTRMGNPSENSK